MAAALALAAAQLKPVSQPAAPGLAVAAAIVLAAVGLLRGQQNVEQVRRWTRARSISEAIKSEVFLFLTKSGDYSTSDREVRLEAEVQRLENEADDLQRYAQGIEPQPHSLPQVYDLNTVGSAYVGSNPTPATKCGNGPLAGNSRLCGPFGSASSPLSSDALAVMPSRPSRYGT
jgi:hypothetical protein